MIVFADQDTYYRYVSRTTMAEARSRRTWRASLRSTHHRAERRKEAENLPVPWFDPNLYAHPGA